MTEKKLYAAPDVKVSHIETESLLLVSDDPQGQSNESYSEGSTEDWF